METFVASLFSVSVLGFGLSCGLFCLVVGYCLGWRARDRESLPLERFQRQARAIVRGR